MKKVLIIAGEVSGDIHGANLVRAVKERLSNVEFYGLGGKNMEASGVKLYYNLVDIAVLGVFEVIKKYITFRKILNIVVRKLDSEKFDCVILIDYPGFNLRFARYVKNRGIPIVYYISPQVWAWGGGRIKLIKKLVNKIVVFFRFEEELYKNQGLQVEFVGHPLVDVVKPSLTKEEALKLFGLESGKKTITFFPGSRAFEVKALLPIMLEAGELIKKECPDVQFLIARLTSLKKELFDKFLNRSSIKATLVEGKTYEAIEAADLMIIKSGTGTLETAILGKPMIITYKAALLTYLITRMVIRLPYIGLANVIAGEKIIPEFLQYNAKPYKIAKEAVSLLNNPKRIDEMKRSLIKIKESLGGPGANERAADVVVRFLSKV